MPAAAATAIHMNSEDASYTPHNFKRHRGRAFSISGQYKYSNVIETGTSVNDFIRYIMDEDADNSQDTSDLLDQYNDNHTWSNQVMGQFT